MAELSRAEDDHLTDPGEPTISVEAYWAVSEERDKAEARAECAEAANERLRGALRQIRDNPFADQWAQFLARVTLSADVESHDTESGT